MSYETVYELNSITNSSKIRFLRQGWGRKVDSISGLQPRMNQIFVVFIFQSSSCLSDRDEEELYDLAAKYEGKSFGNPPLRPKITSPR